MAGSTPVFGFPYPQSSDLVANYPALGQQLAEDVETEIIANRTVVQVVASSTSSQVTTNGSAQVDTGLSATITPTSASNDIIVFISQNGVRKQSSDTSVGLFTYRDSTQINQFSLAGYTNSTAANDVGGVSLCVKDSPATISAVTYKTRFNSAANSASVFVQVGSIPLSTIILMEVQP